MNLRPQVRHGNVGWSSSLAPSSSEIFKMDSIEEFPPHPAGGLPVVIETIQEGGLTEKI
jgi:hypothetical protein